MAITLEDEIDISRGDMIVRKDNVPTIRNEFEAFLCWMNEKELNINKQYIVQHTSRQVQVFIEDILYRINVDTLQREEVNELKLNEIGRVKLKTSQSLFFDPYQINQKTGSFIIIDSTSNVTVAAGMIRAGSTASKEVHVEESKDLVSPNVTWEPWNISREEREERNGQKAKVLWFTGISGAGKSTIAKAWKRNFGRLETDYSIDGDQVRHGLNGDLGFTAKDRKENIRRVGHLAQLFYEHGNIVLCTFISPYANDRAFAKSLIDNEHAFIEIHVTCNPKKHPKRS